MQRRTAIAAILTGVASPFFTGRSRIMDTRFPTSEIAAIERHVSGRLGVAAIDIATGRRLTYRATERFPMCSTFKWLLAAQVLAFVDAGQEQLSRVIPFSSRDLLDYAPITRGRVGDGGLSVAELSAAAVRHSDNTAANLLLRRVGGPASLTAYLRQLGDAVTRLDRIEPHLNSALPGDVRDTTTPSAMIANMEALLLRDRLTGSSRALLLDWLVGNTTGDDKLRAGFPPGWRVGDKTGSGANGTTNDVAIIWPSSEQPLLVAAYLTETSASLPARAQAIAAVARTVATWVEKA